MVVSQIIGVFRVDSRTLRGLTNRLLKRKTKRLARTSRFMTKNMLLIHASDVAEILARI